MSLNRRQIIKAAASSASIATLAPNMVFGIPGKTREKFRIAAVGFGGRGKADLNEMKSHPNFELTAACDVDQSMHKNVDGMGSDIKKFQDYRLLFKNSADDFDAVVIATPDHMHAPIALMAMEHDKHVYLQKPLAQDIAECRLLAEQAAQKTHLKTQMGIQIRYRRQHWHNGPIFRGHETCISPRQSPGSCANLIGALSTFYTTPSRYQGERKIAFPFVQTHASGR